MKKDLQSSPVITYKLSTQISPITKQLKDFTLSPKKSLNLSVKIPSSHQTNTSTDAGLSLSPDIQKPKSSSPFKPNESILSLSALSPGLPKIEKNNASSDSQIQTPKKEVRVKVTKLRTPIIEYSHPTMLGSQSQRGPQRELSISTQAKERLTPRVETGPSFLAPTLATLQHLKEVKMRRDSSVEKGFSFARPMGPHAEYFAPGMVDEGKERISRAISRGDAMSFAGSSLSNLTRGSSEKSAFQGGKKQPGHIVKNSLSKHFMQREQKFPENELIPPPNEIKPDEIRRISNILTKELEAKWGRISTFSSCSEDESKEVSQDSSMEASKEEEKLEKVENKRAEGSSPNLKENKDKITVIDTKFFKKFKKSGSKTLKRKETNQSIKDKQDKSDGYIKKGNRDTKNSSASPTRLQTIGEVAQTDRTERTEKIDRDNIFSEKASGFFQLNGDNKLFATLNDIFDKDGGRFKMESKRTLDENAPMIVALSTTNKIIQPNYMKHKGSMCVTEFWSQKSNNTFTRHFGRNSKQIIIKMPGRENETVYRPEHWQKQHELKDHILHDHPDTWGSSSLNFSRRPEKSRTSVVSNKKNSLSPDRIDPRMNFRNVDKNPPSLLQKIEFAGVRFNRRANNSTDTLDNSSLRISGIESPRNKRKNELAQLDFVRLKAFSGRNKKEAESARLNEARDFGLDSPTFVDKRQGHHKDRKTFITFNKNRDGSL